MNPQDNELGRLRVELGQHLRTIRLAAGLSGKQLAFRMGVSQSKVSRIERGHRTASERDVHRMANALDLGDDTREELVFAVRKLAGRGAYRERGNVVRPQDGQATIAQLEEGAREIRVFVPWLIPGLLQTASYARKVLELVWATASAPPVEIGVRTRMERQARLYDGSKQFGFLFLEQTLDFWGMPSSIVEEQLVVLLMRLDLPNVRIGIVPESENFMSWVGPFTLFDSDVVEIDVLRGAVFLYDPVEIGAFVESYADLAECAVYDDDAREIVRHRLDKFRSRPLPEALGA